MTTYYDSTDKEFVNRVPIVKQLNAIFKTIPDEELMSSLTASTGRPGYTVKVLWRTYVAMYVLNLRSFADLIRYLHNNPLVAVACGITEVQGIPSKFAYSRFMRKLSLYFHVVEVKDVMRKLTRKLYEELPDFGKSVALDASDLQSFSNGAKKPTSDSDASWGVKLDTCGNKKRYFGYKINLLADTKYELPIAANLSTASIHDVRIASRVLSEARFTYSKWRPEYVIADAGYCSEKLRRLIKRQYRGKPIIKENRRSKANITPETEEFRRVYSSRTSIERLFGRLKGYRKLNSITVRGRHKVIVHCFMSLIIVQAHALHSFLSNNTSSVRKCVSAVA